MNRDQLYAYLHRKFNPFLKDCDAEVIADLDGIIWEIAGELAEKAVSQPQ